MINKICAYIARKVFLRFLKKELKDYYDELQKQLTIKIKKHDNVYVVCHPLVAMNMIAIASKGDLDAYKKRKEMKIVKDE